MKKKSYGFLASKNLNIECLGEVQMAGECRHYQHLLNKFSDDQFFREDEGKVGFLTVMPIIRRIMGKQTAQTGRKRLPALLRRMPKTLF